MTHQEKRSQGRSSRILVLTPYPEESPCSRFRIIQYIPELERNGIRCSVSSFLSPRGYRTMYMGGKWVGKVMHILLGCLKRTWDLLRVLGYDAVFVQREAMTVGPAFVEMIIAKMLRKPLILDLDDATFIPYWSPRFGRCLAKLKFFSKAFSLMKMAQCVIVGNGYLKTYATRYNSHVVLIPSNVDTDSFMPRASPAGNGRVTVGWIGTHSTFIKYYPMLVPVFEALVRENDFTVMVVYDGKRETMRIPGVDVVDKCWENEREMEYFHSIDVGVYPIADDEWAVGKSGLKAVEYMACGIPFVASPVGCVRDMVAHGENGFLASTPQEWVIRLSRLIQDRGLRERMGRKGRTIAVREYSLKRWAPEFIKIITNVLEGTQRAEE